MIVWDRLRAWLRGGDGRPGRDDRTLDEVRRRQERAERRLSNIRRDRDSVDRFVEDLRRAWQAEEEDRG